MMLEASGIVRTFGGVTAVAGVDLCVEAGEIVGLIGPNGAGKTTLFDCISGYLAADAGRVHLDGRDVTGLQPEQRARAGMGRTFQQLEVFTTMTVREHLVAAVEQAGARTGPWWRGWLRPPAAGRGWVEEVLHRFDLARYAQTPADALPTGVLRRVEVARALCTRPSVLLLDEPASGLDPAEVAQLASMFDGLADQGIAMLLVEHDVPFVLELADRLVVMDRGEVIASGRPDEVVRDPSVRSAYLGTATDDRSADEVVA